jgi:hypothetical protein
MSSAPDVKRSTSTNDNGRGHPANAASALAATGPDPARNSSVQQHNLADKAEAAALQAAADAAAAAATEPRILRAVFNAANGRRRHRQRLSSVNPTGHCDSTPTRRKAAPDEAQGESPTQATQNAKAHRHAHRHTNSRRHQHSQAV